MCENVAIRAVRKIFCEFHEAFSVIENAAGESETASGKRSKTAVVERILVALEEPGLDLVDMVRSKAELFAYTDGDPGPLNVSGLEVIGERVSSVVESAKPNLESIAEAVAFVLERDSSLGNISMGEYSCLDECLIRTRLGRLPRMVWKKPEWS